MAVLLGDIDPVSNIISGIALLASVATFVFSFVVWRKERAERLQDKEEQFDKEFGRLVVKAGREPKSDYVAVTVIKEGTLPASILEYRALVTGRTVAIPSGQLYTETPKFPGRRDRYSLTRQPVVQAQTIRLPYVLAHGDAVKIEIPVYALQELMQADGQTLPATTRIAVCDTTQRTFFSEPIQIEDRPTAKPGQQ